MANQASSTVQLPRIAIEFCTQCKWNLRAAYFAQELLQTFGTSVGEIALIPVAGGIFTITMTHAAVMETEEPASTSENPGYTVNSTQTVIWDRKVDGGFPETKELKNRVRNIIEPDRDLGHIDRSLKKNTNGTATAPESVNPESTVETTPQSNSKTGGDCVDCK